MRAPDFWRRAPPAPAARLLAPLAALYGGLAARRLRRPGREAGLPTICVGNFTAGGAGKTPAALALAEALLALGEKPAFLTRGYGGSARGPLRVDPLAHEAALVGDEPLLLARLAPTYVGADRPAAAGLARTGGASVLVLDDGMQNPALVKHATFVVVDAAAGVGNALCLPAGPLRLPMARQWPLVEALILIGEGAPGEALADEARARGLPVFGADLALDSATVAALRGERLLAFAGIGRPEKFFDSLRAEGLDVGETRAFGDHRRFSRADISRLAAGGAALRLATTEKDAARLPPADRSRLAAAGLVVVPARLVWRDPDGLARFLAARLEKARSGPPGGR